jgi:uncharacterized hydrophobic protein (TIGR00271 family)
MLSLRLSVHDEQAEAVVEALGGTTGVHRLMRASAEGLDRESVLAADVAAHAADHVVDLISELGVSTSDFVLARQDVIAPNAARSDPSGDGGGFAWVEIMGEARANSRPLARYLALIAVAAVIAALGVVNANGLLIVGAMAVSPDLLPICATCVGLVGKRFGLARHAFLTLLLGLALVAVVAATLVAVVNLLGLLPEDFELGQGGVGALVKTDYSTILIALAAGVAAMLSFETRASAAVGVAISVTTIPASAYIGVACGLGDVTASADALLVLTVNVVLLIVSGSATLTLQRWASRIRDVRAGGFADDQFAEPGRGSTEIPKIHAALTKGSH